MKNFTNSLAFCGAALLGNTACQVPSEIVAGNSAITIEQDAGDSGNAVCDPFNNGTATSREKGLLASIAYLPNGHTGAYNGVEDFIHKSTPLNVDLYFNQLNVPTRPFDQGFMTQNGTVLETPNGDTLYEFFSLSFESVLKLRPQDSPGLYQLAVLSDDGAILEVKTDASGYREWINNDGDHPTRMGCAQDVIQMNADTEIPIRLKYYQGPRYHIALMLLWRKVGSGANALQDSACGVSGNDAFFDSTRVPIRAQQRWLNVLSRGWVVIGSDSYLLPKNSAPNPCTTPPPVTAPSGSPTSEVPTCSGPFCNGAGTGT